MKFYNLSASEVAKELNSDFTSGLSAQEVQKRFDECSKDKSVSDYTIDKPEFKFVRSTVLCVLSALVYILLSVFKKDLFWLAAGAVFVLICCFGACIFYGYTLYLNSKIDKCCHGGIYKVGVIRDGKNIKLPIDELVYGDIVLLKTGDFISFDGYILEYDSFFVDESHIGNSDFIEKNTEVITEDNVSVSKLTNCVFCGSYVVSGSAKVVVTDVGKRVYIHKTDKFITNSFQFASRLNDYSRLILLVLLLLVSVVSVVNALITKEYFMTISLILVFVALFFTDFLTKLVLIAFSKLFIVFSREHIFLKNISVIDKLNNSDVLVLDYQSLLNSKSTVTGFYDGNSVYSVSELDKHNFVPFLYALLAGNGDYSKTFNKAFLKSLKKINLDFDDIESLSPSISYFNNANCFFEISGRVHDGSNVLIAKGDYAKISEICSDCAENVPTEILNRLQSDSTDLIGVAVKNVGIIPNDLSVERSGFELVGIIAVKRNIDKSTWDKIGRLNNYGYSVLLSYCGNQASAEMISETIGFECIDYNSVLKSSKALFLKNTLVYGYGFDCSDISSKLLELNLKPVCFANSLNNSKIFTFGLKSWTPYELKNCDVVCNDKISDCYSVIDKTRQIYGALNYTVENILTFVFSYILCGLFNAIFNRQLIFSPAVLAFVTAVSLVFSALSSLYIGKNFINNLKKYSSKPVKRYNIVSAAISSACFLIALIILGFIFDSAINAAFVSVMLTSFLPRFEYSFKDKLYFCRLFSRFIPALILSLMFISPISVYFGVESFTVLLAIVAIMLGSAVRVITDFIIKKIVKD